LSVCSRRRVKSSAGWASQPKARARSFVGAGVEVAGGDDLGDAVHGGVDCGGVAGFEAGDEGAQAVLVGAAQAEVAAAAFGLAAFVVQGGVGFDDLGLGDGQDPAGGFGGDQPGDRGVHHADLVAGQVARQLRDTAGEPGLALAAAADRPGQGQTVLEVQDVGDRVRRRGDPGGAGQGDLAEAEVRDAGGAITAELPEHVADPAGDVAVGTFGGVGGVHGRPGGKDLEGVDLREPGGALGLGRGGEEAGRVEVVEVDGHESILEKATDSLTCADGVVENCSRTRVRCRPEWIRQAEVRLQAVALQRAGSRTAAARRSTHVPRMCSAGCSLYAGRHGAPGHSTEPPTCERSPGERRGGCAWRPCD
jgi:hypothetical protein